MLTIHRLGNTFFYIIVLHLCTCLSILWLLGDSCEFGSATYYAYCGLGGILSCGITHTAVVPLDLVKCRIQVIIYA